MKPITEYLFSKEQKKPDNIIASLVQTQVAICTYDRDNKQIGHCAGFFIDNLTVISVKEAFHSVHRASIHTPTGHEFNVSCATILDDTYLHLYPEIPKKSGFYPKTPECSEILEEGTVWFSENPIHTIASLKSGVVGRRNDGQYYEVRYHPGIPGIAGAPVINSDGCVVGIIISSMEKIIIAPISEILNHLRSNTLSNIPFPIDTTIKISEGSIAGKDFQCATELLFENKQIDKALQIFRKLYRKYNLSEAYYNAALCRKGHTRIDYGIRMINKAIQHNPKYIPYYLTLGVLYFQKRQYKKSIHCLEHILSLDSLNIPAYVGMMKSYEKIDKKDKSSDIFREMIEQATVRIEIDNIIEVRECRNGFLIIRDGEIQQYLLLKYTHLSVYSSPFEAEFSEEFAFPEYERFIDYIVNSIIQSGESGNTVKKEIEYSIRRIWEIFMYRTDGIVRGIQHRLYSVTGKNPNILLQPQFYQHPLLIRDIMRYRAAAVAVAFAEELLVKKKVKQLLLSQSYKHFQYEAFKTGVRVQLGAGMMHSMPTKLIEELKNWRTLYGEPSRRLNKTLSNLPEGLRSIEICAMAEFILPKALINRLEYLFTICYLDMDTENERRFYRIISESTEEDIKRGMELVSGHLERNLQMNSSGIREYIRYIYDYPHRYYGTLEGLTRQAIEWHEQMARIDTIKADPSLDLDQKTCHPPILPPQDDNIKFLSTVKEIIDEGKQLKHCVASYAEKACQGDYFLFRVTLSKSRATTLVDRKGNVVQSYGPKNSHNAASAYGRKILDKWGKDFPMNIGGVYVDRTGESE